MSSHPGDPSPLKAAILIGGASARMGSPKHLLVHGGRSWLERTISVVSPLVRQILLIGSGDVPPACRDLPRIADTPEVRGPIAGILAALRHDRETAWLVVACDLPRLHADALVWLIAQRRADSRGVLPRRAEGRPEPLLAIYESTALDAVEALVAAGGTAPRELAHSPGFQTPTPPVAIRSAWTNVNTPGELAALD